MLSDLCVSVMVPSFDILLRLSLPSTGSRWVRFPRFRGNTKRSDSLPPYPLAFVFLRPAVTVVHREFAPLRASMRTPAARRTSRGPSLVAASLDGGGRSSQVPGGPPCVRAPAPRPRWAGMTRLTAATPVLPSDVRKTSAPRFRLSRLTHAARTLAVYASPRGLPQRDARLASGCSASLAGRGWLPAGSLNEVSDQVMVFLLVQAWPGAPERSALQVTPPALTCAGAGSSAAGAPPFGEVGTWGFAQYCLRFIMDRSFRNCYHCSPWHAPKSSTRPKRWTAP